MGATGGLANGMLSNAGHVVGQGVHMYVPYPGRRVALGVGSWLVAHGSALRAVHVCVARAGTIMAASPYHE